MLNFLKNISSTELIILAVILLVFFGAKAFTTLGRTSGETFREIKKIKKNLTEAFEDNEPNKNNKEVTK
jgi:Sec-independent protein translocase protein TatA